MPGELDGRIGNEVGRRAENVAQWYFRLNGFLLIPSFVLHPDNEEPYALTDVDILGVRFPHSRERIGDRDMEDDPLLLQLAHECQTLFVMVESKANEGCKLNGAWKQPERGNMQRAIRRLGFATESSVDSIAKSMYHSLRWEDDRYVLQYVCIGRVSSPDYCRTYPDLVQLTWDNVADFLFSRFEKFPEKLPTGQTVHQQWPRFGRGFGSRFRSMRSNDDARKTVKDYIETGWGTHHHKEPL
jgi:hypothetical protein